MMLDSVLHSSKMLLYICTLNMCSLYLWICSSNCLLVFKTSGLANNINSEYSWRQTCLLFSSKRRGLQVFFFIFMFKVICVGKIYNSQMKWINIHLLITTQPDQILELLHTSFFLNKKLLKLVRLP